MVQPLWSDIQLGNSHCYYVKEVEVDLQICLYGTNTGYLALRMLVVGSFFSGSMS